MKNILKIIEETDKTTEKFLSTKLQVTIEFEKMRGDDFYVICSQENLNVEKQESILGNIYHTEWKINKNLVVRLSTDYLPKTN